MSLSNSEIKLYTDIMIVEAVLSDETGLSKFAQEGRASELINAVHGYFSNHVDPNNKAGSFLNIIAPGAISLAFRALGLGWLGFLIGLCMNFFHINVAGIISSIWTGLKSELSGGNLMDSAKVDSLVNSAVETHATPATQEEADKTAQTFNIKTTSLKDAKMVKLALIEFAAMEQGIIKQSGFLDMFRSRKGVTASILSRTLGLFFKVALASAGLMVAGDVISKLLGRPNALDNTRQEGKPSADTTAPAMVSRQTKFKVNPSYHDTGKKGWIENIPNNKESIQQMVLKFAKEVYQGLDSSDANIMSTAGFQAIVDNILWNNHTSAGEMGVFIPNMFTSKKMMVDHFMDEVAEKAT